MVNVHRPEGKETERALLPGPGILAEDTGHSAAMLNEFTYGADQQRTTRDCEVTVLTTRSGTTAVVVPASDRDAALGTVREQLASGDFTAPPEQCTNDIQTEIWTIRELH